MGGKVGVLVLNLGTPDGTDYWSMRRYLSEFLSDKRVIDWPAAVWQPILQGIILSIRPSRKGKDYESIWNKERNEGPLLTITRSQTEKLAAELALLSDKIVVDFAMRYGNPATGPAIDNLLRQGCDRILLLPMYPQYSVATTATAADQAFRQLMRMEWQPSVRVAPPWHDDPSISMRWRPASASISPRWTSSPRCCSPRSTACRSATSSRATRIIASA